MLLSVQARLTVIPEAEAVKVAGVVGGRLFLSQTIFSITLLLSAEARLKENLTEEKSSAMESTGTVRPLRAARATKPKTEEPKSFNEVTAFADQYKSGNAVLIRLEGVEHAVARRIIDFASGLCYSEKGEMERMGNQEYLLVPKDVTVDPETREKIKTELKHISQE